MGGAKATERRSPRRAECASLAVARAARPISTGLAALRSLEEATDQSSLYDGGWVVGLIRTVIAEHVRQNLGVEDAARRRDEGAEILLAVESISEPDALGGEMVSP